MSARPTDSDSGSAIRKMFIRVLPAVLGLGLFLTLTHGDLMFSSDSVFYWSAARTLLFEHQLATGIAYSNNPLEPGLLEGPSQPLHPLTLFAPGYAVATAVAAGATGTSIVSATRLVNLLSGAAIILLAGNLARLYCTTLVALRSRTGFEDIGVRLLFPALVCVAVLAVLQMSRLARTSRQAAVGAVWVMFSASASILDFPPKPDSLTSHRERNRPVVAWAQQNLTRHMSRSAVIFADDIYSLHFASGQPIHLLPPIAALQALRANSPVDHLLFVIGAPTGVSSIGSETERERYTATLDAQAGDVQRRENYTGWCIPTIWPERTRHNDCFAR